MTPQLLFKREVKCRNDWFCDVCGRPIKRGDDMMVQSYSVKLKFGSITRQYAIGTCCEYLWSNSNQELQIKP